MKFIQNLIIILLLIIGGCSTSEKLTIGSKAGEKWRAIHLLGYENDNDLLELEKIIPALDSMGINVVILEVDYSFEFQSHPELRWGEKQITKKGAREFAEVCRKNDIRLITEFQCLGHQSWAEATFPLLTQYPQFDLTPGAFPGNKDIYCREWDLLNPEVNKIVFQLLDEIIDAFQVDAFHVGMDEVFLLGSEHSPSTKGKDPGELYAKAINDIYNHLVIEKRVEMLMWGDRLFDGKDYEFGEWESSLNGTASAVDMIPKDIIICPWHYEKMPAYPSIQIFINKGFRVLPSSWRDVDAAKSLINFSYELENPKMLGHLFTTWGRTDLLKYPALVECMELVEK
jgi:hypothetical protein